MSWFHQAFDHGSCTIVGGEVRKLWCMGCLLEALVAWVVCCQLRPHALIAFFACRLSCCNWEGTSCDTETCRPPYSCLCGGKPCHILSLHLNISLPCTSVNCTHTHFFGFDSQYVASEHFSECKHFDEWWCIEMKWCSASASEGQRRHVTRCALVNIIIKLTSSGRARQRQERVW